MCTKSCICSKGGMHANMLLLIASLVVMSEYFTNVSPLMPSMGILAYIGINNFKCLLEPN